MTNRLCKWARPLLLTMAVAAGAQGNIVETSGVTSVEATLANGGGELFGAGLVDTADGQNAIGALVFMLEYDTGDFAITQYSRNAVSLVEPSAPVAVLIESFAVAGDDIVMQARSVADDTPLTITLFGVETTPGALQTTGFAQLDDIPFQVVIVQPVDTDGDGVADETDNCTRAVNANQRDTDNDGYGNACDGDYHNDCIENATDLGILRLAFFGTDLPTPNWNPDTDHNGDGRTNAVDLGVFRTGFFMPPGPSAVGACP